MILEVIDILQDILLENEILITFIKFIFLLRSTLILV